MNDPETLAVIAIDKLANPTLLCVGDVIYTHLGRTRVGPPSSDAARIKLDEECQHMASVCYVKDCNLCRAENRR